MNLSTNINTSTSTTYPMAATTTTVIPWTEEEKKALVKIGLRYNKKKNNWNIDLTASIVANNNESFNAILETIKQLKKDLINKLTAKIILMELIKPHEIKE